MAKCFLKVLFPAPTWSNERDFETCDCLVYATTEKTPGKT